MWFQLLWPIGYVFEYESHIIDCRIGNDTIDPEPNILYFIKLNMCTGT